MTKRSDYSGPMQPYMLPEIYSELASYMRNNPKGMYATQMKMRTATPRKNRPVMEDFGGYERIYANYPRQAPEPANERPVTNFGRATNPNYPRTSLNAYGEPDMGGYMRNMKRKSGNTGRSTSKNMRKGPSGTFVEPSVKRNLSGNEMQQYLESKALTPDQLRAELAAKRKDFDASGRYTGMNFYDLYTPEQKAAHAEGQRQYGIVLAYLKQNEPPELDDKSIPIEVRQALAQKLKKEAYEYLFPRYDFEAIRNKSLEALQNSPNGYIQSYTPTPPTPPTQPAQPAQPAAKNPFAANTKQNKIPSYKYPKQTLPDYTMSNVVDRKKPYTGVFSDFFNNFGRDSTILGQSKNQRKAKNPFVDVMPISTTKRMSKRAIPTQRTANIKNKYGI